MKLLALFLRHAEIRYLLAAHDEAVSLSPNLTNDTKGAMAWRGGVELLARSRGLTSTETLIRGSSPIFSNVSYLSSDMITEYRAPASNQVASFRCSLQAHAWCSCAVADGRAVGFPSRSSAAQRVYGRQRTQQEQVRISEAAKKNAVEEKGPATISNKRLLFGLAVLPMRVQRKASVWVAGSSP